MESNKKTIFDIVSGDELVIVKTIENYNTDYKTDFEILGFENRDGVLFATITTTANPDDIFQLGCFFGIIIQYKRDHKEIDW